MQDNLRGQDTGTRIHGCGYCSFEFKGKHVGVTMTKSVNHGHQLLASEQVTQGHAQENVFWPFPVTLSDGPQDVLAREMTSLCTFEVWSCARPARR